MQTQKDGITMAEKIEIVEEKVDEGRRAFVETARKVLLASVGAVAVAQEELESFVNRLIERGEIAEKDGRKMLDDIRSRRGEAQEKAEDQAKKAQSQVDKRIEDILERLNVPTKSDIEKLSQKITRLSKKVDDLKKEQEQKEMATAE
jgi:poly(hydroxyalkanoate) granule-associated protein